MSDRLVRAVRARYLGDEWDDLRRRCGLTPDEVMARTLACFAAAEAMGFPQRTVHNYRLDNPYMQEHARATLAARARCELANHWRHKRRNP
jgi:hypothetical protein